MSDDRDQLAKRMQFLCDELGLDKSKRQTLLAKKYGVSITTGRNWVNGLKLPSYEQALAMCRDAKLTYEWLMTGNGAPYSSDNVKHLVITDPDLIKLVELAQPLPTFARKMAIKEIDTVCKFAEQAKAEYTVQNNTTPNST